MVYNFCFDLMGSGVLTLDTVSIDNLVPRFYS